MGEHTGTVEPCPQPVPSAADADPDLPLAGVKVLDLTSWWAGPSATGTLAMLGADVTHIESTGHPDGMRMTGFMFGTEDWWEWSSMYVAINHNKRDLTLDLDTDAGMDLLWRLMGRPT